MGVDAQWIKEVDIPAFPMRHHLLPIHCIVVSHLSRTPVWEHIGYGLKIAGS